MTSEKYMSKLSIVNCEVRKFHYFITKPLIHSMMANVNTEQPTGRKRASECNMFSCTRVVPTPGVGVAGVAIFTIFLESRPE